MRRPTLLFATLLAAGPSAPAHPEPAPPPPPARVLLYSEPNYRGEVLIAPAGTTIENLEYTRDGRGKKWNDRIMSVRIEGPVVFVAFEHANFRGAQTTITRNSADLYTLSLGERTSGRWDHRISSFRVELVRPDAPVRMAWTRRDAERAIRSAYRDMLGREPDDAGLKFYFRRLLDDGWTEDRLRDELRRSDEFRHRDLGALVRKVYREVLGREPDPSGLATYTRALQGGMSEAEFRADLHRSGELAEKNAREAVTRAYRDILRREPDPAGLANYLKLMLERGWDETRVRDTLRKSDEYRNLPPRH